jgi:transcription antitermination factor NusG
MSEMERINQMQSELAGANWYAVCVRYQNEQRVEQVLEHQGWETLVPRYRSRREWSDRVKEVEAALFGGFVFCRFAPGERMRVEDSPGVLRIVKLKKSNCWQARVWR